MILLIKGRPLGSEGANSLQKLAEVHMRLTYCPPMHSVAPGQLPTRNLFESIKYPQIGITRKLFSCAIFISMRKHSEMSFDSDQRCAYAYVRYM